jgi:hypothetical protein
VEICCLKLRDGRSCFVLLEVWWKPVYLLCDLNKDFWGWFSL